MNVGQVFLCKDGRIRKIQRIGTAKYPWNKNVTTEVIAGKPIRNPVSRLSVQTIKSYIIAEVPEAYHDQLDRFPDIYALKQTLIEIDCKQMLREEVPDRLIYQAMAQASAAGMYAGIKPGPDRMVAMIELPTGVVRFDLSAAPAWDTPLTIEHMVRMRKFTGGIGE